MDQIMQLEVKRFEYGDSWTIGRFYIDGEYFCYTLEDKVREGPKVPKETAIPTGTYTVVVDMSSHFGRDLPHVLGVPEFDGIRIHPGNSDKDTEGCILLGGTWAGGDFVGDSRKTFDSFFARLSEAGAATITITNGGQTT
jgi:hypothetical protein